MSLVDIAILILKLIVAALQLLDAVLRPAGAHLSRQRRA